mgnify:CR=1 FL=1
MGYGAEDAMRLAMKKGVPVKRTPFQVVCLITERALNIKVKPAEVETLMDDFLHSKKFDYIRPDLEKRSKALLNNHQDEYKEWLRIKEEK